MTLPVSLVTATENRSHSHRSTPATSPRLVVSTPIAIVGWTKRTVDDHFAEMRCGHFAIDPVKWIEWYYEFGKMSGSSDNHLSRSPAGLLVRIDTHSRDGLRQQVYTAVRRAILDGVLAPGTPL